MSAAAESLPRGRGRAVWFMLVYGTLSGLAIISTMIAGLLLTGRESFFSSEWFGYFVMLVALTFVFAGVKRYRDVDLGGVIRFAPAFAVGLAIATVASLTYVAVWEVYLATTDYAFINQYFGELVREAHAAGGQPETVAREISRLVELKATYDQPLVRIPMTFLEIFPVGLLVSLVSAALLRNPRFMPGRR